MASQTLKTSCVLLPGLYCLFLAPSCMGVPTTDQANLKALFDGHRWFELRDSVTDRRTAAFYQGVVACAFNEARRCKNILGSVIRSHPKSDEAIEANKRLASSYLTLEKYREALVRVNAVLAVKPDDSDALGVQPLLAALSEFPDQQMLRRRSTALELQEGGLPFSINSVQATWDWQDRGSEAESVERRVGARGPR
jgi:hypothetical protein